MAWLFAQESAASNSASSSPLDPPTLACAGSNGKPIPRPYSWRGWKTRPWSRRLFGAAISASSIRAYYRQLTCSPLDFPVSHIASQASNSAPPTTATSGRKSAGLPMNSTQASFSWRTSPASCDSPTSTSCLTFRDWAIALRRDYSARLKSGRRTGGSGCSSWHTPKVHNIPVSKKARAVDSSAPTLEDDWKAWATSDNTSSRGNRLSVDAQSKRWATPHASSTTGAGTQGRDGGENIQTQAGRWPTPAARDWKDGSNPSEKVPTNGLLGRRAPRWNPINGPPMCLNPLFVEMLMGFPPGWTSCAPLEMPLCHWWQAMRCELSRLERGC